MDPIILIWIASIVCGYFAGARKGRGLFGLLLGLLLGPIGVIIALVIPQAKGFETPAEKNMKAQLAVHQQQLVEMRKIAAAAQIPATPTKETLRISSKGKDLGDLSVSRVKQLLSSGSLSASSDMYYDWDAQQWMALDCCPRI